MFELLTSIISAASGLGVGTVVGNIVEYTTPSNTKRLTRVLTKVGALAITAVLSDLCADKIEKDLNEYHDRITGTIEAVDNLNKEEEDEDGDGEDVIEDSEID